uniref:B box-type domain-containing protein n=1 Tax=Fagus sylvatica TaxID=28930 RepID=A0A2N9IUI1_FAGSY
MEPVCEFCGVLRAVVYCKSDLARLCLQCDGCKSDTLCGFACSCHDRHIHSANSLSRRHMRSLLCDKCNSQPAIVRCMDDKMSLCQGCDWNANECSRLGHRRQSMNCYTGCPSLAELSRIWSSLLDTSSSSNFDSGWDYMNTLPMNENCISNNCLEQRDNEGSLGLVVSKPNELEPCSKFESWMGLSSLIPPNPNYMPHCRDQTPVFPEESNFPKASSSGQQDCIAFQSSHVGGSTSMMQAVNGSPNCLLLNPTHTRNINLGFPPGQVHSSISLSLSNITGESSAADYQDCGLSPVFLTVESPWESNLEASCPQARDKAKMRYNEKKKSRTYVVSALN